ncbi:hypothetical protein [Microbacterium sp.]|nr:hypothetical protein [Microbacterium sp.]
MSDADCVDTRRDPALVRDEIRGFDVPFVRVLGGEYRPIVGVQNM